VKALNGGKDLNSEMCKSKNKTNDVKSKKNEEKMAWTDRKKVARKHM